MHHLTLRTKLLGALLGVGLLTLLVTGWQAYQHAEAALQQAAINHLTSIREERRRQIEAYFASVRQDGLRLAESHEIIEAMREFKAAHRAFEAEVAQWPQAVRDRSRTDIERYYHGSVVSRLQALESSFSANEIERYVPAEDVTIALQALFLAANPNPETARDRLDRPTGGGRYADVHAQHHPFLRTVIRQAGYDDLFLID